MTAYETFSLARPIPPPPPPPPPSPYRKSVMTPRRRSTKVCKRNVNFRAKFKAVEPSRPKYGLSTLQNQIMQPLLCNKIVLHRLSESSILLLPSRSIGRASCLRYDHVPLNLTEILQLFSTDEF